MMQDAPERLRTEDLQANYPGYEGLDLGALDGRLDELDRERIRLFEWKKEEEERAAKTRAQASSQVAGEIEQLYDRLARVRTIRADLPDTDSSDGLVDKLTSLEAEIQSRVKALVDFIGYDPRERADQARRAGEARSRLASRAATASNQGQLRSLINELEQALPLLDIEDAASILEQVEKNPWSGPVTEELGELRHRIQLLSDPKYAAQEQGRLEEEKKRAVRQGELSRAARDLLDEIRNGAPYLEELTKEEVLNQISIWAGRARIVQFQQDLLSPDASSALVQIFGILTKASKELQPGFCEALDRHVERDWPKYVELHEQARGEILQRARAARERAQRHQEEAERAQEREEEKRRRGTETLDELKAVLYRAETDEEGLSGGDLDAFRAAVADCLQYLPGTHPGLLDLVRPHVAHLQGRAFKALRRGLGRGEDDVEEVPAEEELTPEVETLAAVARSVWQGKTLALVGGRRRPEVAEQLEDLLGLEDLRWVETAEGKPRAQGNLIQSIRAGGTDVVVILIEFVGHNSNEVREACEAVSVPCFNATGGIGIRGILLALGGRGREA